MISTIIGQGGPLALAVGMLVAATMLVARGLVVPRSIVESRLADKQQIVDISKEALAKSLEASELQRSHLGALIDQLTQALKNINEGGGSR